MSGPLLCLCGEVLVEQIDERGFITPRRSSESIPFRRLSDHVICENCMRSYHARDLAKLATDPKVIEMLNEIVRRGRDRRRG